MGWFWASAPELNAPRVVRADPVAPPVRVSHASCRSSTTDEEKPSCPMHKSTSPPSFGSRGDAMSPPSAMTASDSSCPYKPDNDIRNKTAGPSRLSRLNPLNFMPSYLSNDPTSTQSVTLPRDREPSTIPRSDGTGNWEYPSPQQMYNALLRKGYDDTPAEHVEAMVAVHNFLNEGAWGEIREWERRFSRGLSNGWKECSHGEEGAAKRAAEYEYQRSLRQRNVRKTADGKTDIGGEDGEPKLVRFMGRPSDMTPKAHIMQALSWMYPAGFSQEPPFDRHDWYVLRRGPNGRESQVRYVIDYYSGPPEPSGEPVFYLDVRPAVDGPTAACERMMRWGGDVWWRAVGGSVREANRSRS